MASCSYQVTYAMIAMLGKNPHVKQFWSVSWDPLKCILNSGASWQGYSAWVPNRSTGDYL